MKTLEFEVNGQYINRKDNAVPVAKCRNLYKAKFDFLTDEWSGTNTGLFIQGTVAKSMVIDDNGECEIPWEFFDTDSDTFGYVSVFCGDLVTANRAVVKIKKSGYTESDASVPPTPDVYQQIIEKLDTLHDDGIISGGTFGDDLGMEVNENGN